MTIPTRLGDLSATDTSNLPTNTEAISTDADAYFRAMYQILRGDLATQGSVLSSGSPLLVNVQGLFHEVSGSSTITSLDTMGAGIWKILRFQAALSLVHNATSLILPSGANITTAVDDRAIFVSLGSGNWQCLAYMRAAATVLKEQRLVGEITATGTATEPTGFIFCAGQPVSRTVTYNTLFALIGTAFGSGDGSTTFNVPDLRGRVTVGKDDMGGSAASRITAAVSTITGTTLGAAGGSQSSFTHTHTPSISDPGHGTSHIYTMFGIYGTGGNSLPPTFVSLNALYQIGGVDACSYLPTYITDNTSAAASGASFSVATSGGGSSGNVAPGIVLNYVVKY